MESAMSRARASTQPKTPTSPMDFAEILRDKPEAAAYRVNFQGMVTFEDQVAVVFCSNSMLERMPQVNECLYDGTFYVVPKLFYQLFTINGIIGEHSFPLVHVLMTHKSEELYLAVAEKVCELCPHFSPQSFIGDFEQASYNAIGRWFPNARRSGCQFHFSRGLWKKVQKLGLEGTFKANDHFRYQVKCLMSLPFLPAAFIRPMAAHTFSSIRGMEGFANETKVQVRKFTSYVSRFWLTTVTPERMSVYDLRHSTNNHCEALHSRLKSRIRSHHPSIWTFVGHLNNLTRDTELELLRLDGGLQITRPRKLKSVKCQQRREECKAKLADGSYTPLQYLRAIAHTMDSSISLLQSNSDDRLDLGLDDESLEREVDDDTTGGSGATRGPDAPQAEADDSTQEGSRPTCAVCLGVRASTVLYLNCKHALVCKRCDNFIALGRPCPVCRTPIVQKIDIFDR